MMMQIARRIPPEEYKGPVVVVCSPKEGYVEGTIDGLYIEAKNRATGACTKRPRILRGETLSWPLNIRLVAYPFDPTKYEFSHWRIRIDEEITETSENPLVRTFSHGREIWIEANYKPLLAPPTPIAPLPRREIPEIYRRFRPAPPEKGEEPLVISPPPRRPPVIREEVEELLRRLREIDEELRTLKRRMAELEAERREILTKLARPVRLPTRLVPPREVVPLPRVYPAPRYRPPQKIYRALRVVY